MQQKNLWTQNQQVQIEILYNQREPLICGVVEVLEYNFNHPSKLKSGVHIYKNRGYI
jgi:hypothetical protein